MWTPARITAWQTTGDPAPVSVWTTEPTRHFLARTAYHPPGTGAAADRDARAALRGACRLYRTDLGPRPGPTLSTTRQLLETGGNDVPRVSRTVDTITPLKMRGEHVSRAKRVFSPEFREDAVRLVIDSSRPIASVARELQIGEGTLGNWVNVYRRDHVGEEPALDVSERARLRELERKYREVKLENEFLKKAAAYFAQDPR